MSAFSTFASNGLLEYVFNGQAFPSPTNLWLALYLIAPDASGGGTEVSGNNYARVQLTGLNVTGNLLTNTAPIVFNQATGGNWGVIVAVGVHDASTGGNLWQHGPISPNENVVVGDIAQFPAGDFEIQWV